MPDIRQNSAFHDKAVSQLLAAAGFDDVDFANWTEEKRLTFLNEELASPRPFVRAGTELPPEASAVLDSYQVVYHHIQHYGTEGIGAFIVSMTRSTSDLLTVYLLGREAGLVFPTAEGLVCEVPVVPLFETIEDLQGSAAILDSFLQHPVTRRSLLYQQKQRNVLKPMQQVMVGYSDSNKDGGILASLWNVHCGQRSLTKVGEKHSVGVYFFHGRGGTVSRGGGPTHRFIESLPAGSVQGNLRLTEQGETIAQKYANHITSVYHLELLTAGTAKATLRQHSSTPQPHLLDPILDRLSAMSSRHYQTLLQTPGFMEFFAKVTPIDVIESSRIGSRPARRTGQRTLADLRAIPWVFSWSQSRFFLSAWYGIGTALEQLEKEYPHDFNQLVRQAVGYAPFRYILTNASSAIMMAHVPIMQSYALLMDDVAIREQFMELITSELERSRRLIEKIYGTTLEERRPRIAKMIALRQSKLEILHQYQIEKICQWRSMKETAHAETESVLFELLLTLNAIADGLRATG